MSSSITHSENVDEEFHHVTSALQAIFTASTNPQQRSQADQYLTSFQHAPVAWMVCDRLLQQQTPESENSHFFAAQTLHTKCRTMLDQLPAEALPSLRDALVQHLTHSHHHHALTTRLALAISALAVYMGWTTIVTDLLLNNNTGSAAAWQHHILLVLPEECASERLLVNDTARFAMRDHLVDTAAQLLLQQQSLPLVRAWIRHVPLTPTLVASLVPPVAMVTNNNTSHDSVVMSVDVWVEIIRNYPSHRPGNAVVVQAMLTLLAQLQQQQQSVVLDSRSYCRIMAEMGESYLSILLLQQQQQQDQRPVAAQLVDWLLASAAVPSHGRRTTLSVWYTLLTTLEQTEPYAWRQELLDEIYAPRIRRLVHICAHQWMRVEDDDDDDDDDDHRHRTYVAETLDDCCRLLGGDVVLQELGEILQSHLTNSSNNNRNAMEACLASLAAIGRYIPRDATSPVLPQCFGWIRQHQPTATAVRDTCYQCMARYAAWLTARPHEFLQPLMPYLGQGLRAGSSAAAEAIQQLCSSRDASFLAQPVLELYEEVGSSLDLSDELLVLKGVCRAATSCADTVLGRLVPALGQRLTQPTTHMDTLIADVDRLTVILRNLPLSNTSETKLQFIQTASWEWLESVLQRHPQSSALAESVCRWHKHALRSVGPAVYGPLCLERLCHQLVDRFVATRHAAFVYCASIVVTEFWSRTRESSSMDGLVLQLVSALTTQAFTFLQNAADFSEHPDVVEELYYMADRLLRHCPDALLGSMQFLHPLIQSAVTVGMQVDHGGAHKGTLTFLARVVVKDASWLVQTGTGAALVANMIQAMCGDLPHSAYAQEIFPDMLWRLYEQQPDALGQWLTSTLASNAMIPDHAKADLLHSFTSRLTQSAFLFGVEEFEQACLRVKRFRRRRP